MEVEAIHSLFNAIDTNGNGNISTEEMKKAIKNGVESEAAELIENFKNEKGKLDKKIFNIVAEGNSKISRSEFLEIFTQPDEEDNIVVITEEEEAQRKKTLELLESIDKNSNGKYTKSEIESAYKKAEKNNDKEMLEFLEPYMTTNKKGTKKIADKDLLEFLGNAKAVTISISDAQDVYGTAETLLMDALIPGSSFLGKKKKKTETTVTIQYMTAENMLTYDANNDGALSAEETKTMRAAQEYFYSIDTNKNGKIGTTEIKKAYKNAADGSELKNMLAQFVIVDEKGNVKLNHKTFKLFSEGKSYITRENLFSADTNSNNTLTQEEIKSRTDLAKEFMKIDQNSNGKSSLNEIKQYAKKNSDSLLAKLLAETETSKEQKKLFKILSDGKDYVTAADLQKFDLNADGVFSEDEIDEILNIANA